MTDLPTLLALGDPSAREPMPDEAARTRMRATVIAAGHAAPSHGRRALLRAAVATGAALTLAASGGIVWRALDTPAFAAVRFEVRLAETAPAPDLREAPVGTSPAVVYLHDTAVVSNEHVVACRVVPGGSPGRFGVEVQLSPEGGARLREATRRHVGRPVALIVDGLVLLAPIVRSEIAEVGVLTGEYSKDDAERLVRGIVGR